MFAIKIGIFSNDTEFAEWLALECIACGADVRCFSPQSSELDWCDIVFFDTSMSVSLPVGNYILVGIYRGAEIIEDMYDAVLNYPFLIEDVRNIILNLPIERGIPHQDKKYKDSRYTIYLNEGKRQASLFNIKITLSDYEMRILKRLCQTPASTVSREELVSLFEKNIAGNMVDVYVCRLRKKLESATLEKVIYTIRGQGYLTNYSVKEWKQIKK